MADTAYARLLAALEAHGSLVRPRGADQASAQCPCPDHEDREPSLSLRAIEGQALVWCHGGCATEDVVAALKWSMADLYDDCRGARYRYDDGRVVNRRYRDGRKEFVQYRAPKGNATRFYRLSRVVEAVKSGTRIALVEGEKDVHAIESLGAVATTAPMGASNFRRVDPSPLSGAQVVAIVDQDDAGQRWARDVRAHLHGVAASLEFRSPQVGKDAADHVAAGRELADLVEWHLPEELPADGWDEPLPLTWRTDLPRFPLDALPGTIGDYAAALAEATQTPPDMAGTVVLGTTSGCIGGRVRVRARVGWIEPTNLWTVPVAHSGSRKSAVMEAAGSPLLDAEARLREAIAKTRRDAQVERAAKEKYAKALLAEAAAGCDPNQLEAAKKAAADAEAVTIPIWPQLTVDDCTPEALVTVLAEQGGRVVAISAEAGLFESLAGTSYNKRSKVETILKAHAGDTIRVDRQHRDQQTIRRPALTLICSIQPYALRQLVSNDEYSGRGLLQRVLWSLAPDNVGYRKVGPKPVPEQLANDYDVLVRQLAVASGSARTNTLLELSLEAAAEHLAYEERIEVMLRRDEAMGATDLYRNWGAKLAGATLRIAGVLHAGSGVVNWAEQAIGVETMKSAIRIAEYYRAHADAALHPGDDRATADSRALLGWLTGRSSRQFTLRDVRRGAPRRFRTDATYARSVIDRLAELGWCREAESGWELHPRAAEHLKACDTCDSGDESAGQEGIAAGNGASHGGATGGDAVRQPAGTVAPRRTPGRRDTDSATGPATSENGSRVAPVARVARGTCPDCGWSYGSTGHEVNCERTRP